MTAPWREKVAEAKCACGHDVDEHGDGGCANGWPVDSCDCLLDRTDALAPTVERLLTEARAEERERIAQAIEMRACDGSPESCADVLAGAPCPYNDAARIARTAAQPATSAGEER